METSRVQHFPPGCRIASLAGGILLGCNLGRLAFNQNEENWQKCMNRIAPKTSSEPSFTCVNWLGDKTGEQWTSLTGISYVTSCCMAASWHRCRACPWLIFLQTPASLSGWCPLFTVISSSSKHFWGCLNTLSLLYIFSLWWWLYWAILEEKRKVLWFPLEKKRRRLHLR